MGILFILFLTGNLYGNILTQMNFHIQIFGITKVKKKKQRRHLFSSTKSLNLQGKIQISNRMKQSEITKDIPSYVPFHLLDHVDD